MTNDELLAALKRMLDNALQMQDSTMALLDDTNSFIRTITKLQVAQENQSAKESEGL